MVNYLHQLLMHVFSHPDSIFKYADFFQLLWKAGSEEAYAKVSTRVMSFGIGLLHNQDAIGI